MFDRLGLFLDALFNTAASPVATLLASLLLRWIQELELPKLTLDQLIAITASIGSLAAAIATYLTVREMKAGRILNARARLTTPGTDQQITFSWERAPKNHVLPPPKIRIIVRNASQGVAHKIRLNWKLENPIKGDGLAELQRWLPASQSVKIVDGHAAHFCDSNVISGVLAVGGESSAHLGDLGPNQEIYTEIPEVILNSVFLTWLHLLISVADGRAVSFDQVPSVEMTLEHSSPYESGIIDNHRIRFELIDEQFKLKAVKSSTAALGGGWKTFQLTLAFETTSRTMYEIPRVVV